MVFKALYASVASDAVALVDFGLTGARAIHAAFWTFSGCPSGRLVAAARAAASAACVTMIFAFTISASCTTIPTIARKIGNARMNETAAEPASEDRSRETGDRRQETERGGWPRSP